MTGPDVMQVLYEMRRQLPPGSQDPLTFLRADNPIARQADTAIATVLELLRADLEYDAAMEAFSASDGEPAVTRAQRRLGLAEQRRAAALEAFGSVHGGSA